MEEMRLWQALGLKDGEIVSFIGGGGKTTSMYELAKDLREQRKKVLVTTTTAIFLPLGGQVDRCIIERNKEEALSLTVQQAGAGIIGLGVSLSLEGKLQGIPPEWVAEFSQMGSFNFILVEADGAKGKPLKAPAAHEPVIPPSTNLTVVVIGIDACWCLLHEDNIHRPEIISEITGVKMGGVLQPKDIASLAVCRQGLLKGIPYHSRVFILINKVDSEERYNVAGEIAREIRGMDKERIAGVLIGNVRDAEQVLAIL